MNLPFGGGKGGIAVDPKDLSEAEIERLTRRFAEELRDIVGPKQDVPAPDEDVSKLFETVAGLVVAGIEIPNGIIRESLVGEQRIQARTTRKMNSIRI